MSLSKESIKRLLQIKAAILAQPELYDQREGPNLAFADGGCGAPCCYAGWAAWLDAPTEADYRKALDMGVGPDLLVTHADLNFSQASRLFSDVDPRNGRVITSAAQGASRIDHFIKTGGAK